MVAETENEKLNNLLGNFANNLDKCVKFGNELIEWYTQTLKPGNEFVPILFSLRYIVEQVDAIAVLIRNSSVEPCKLLLRGITESFLGISYILEKDTKKRAMCFMVNHVHEKLKLYKKLNRNTKEGKEFLIKLKDNTFTKDLTFLEPVEIEKYELNLHNLLEKPMYAEVELEYQKSKKKRPYWYSLYNGPSNLENLAKDLNLTFIYEIFYRQWSGAVHATDIIDGKIVPKEGKSYLLHLRHPKDAQFVVGISMTLLIKTIDQIIKKLLPDKLVEYNNWYFSIRDFYKIVNSKHKFIVME